MKIRMLTLLALFSLVGCASTDIVGEVWAKKDSTYEKKIDRVLISTSFDPSLFIGQVGRSFSDRLRKRGILVQTIAINQSPLDLDPGKELRTNIALFNPNQVMELVVTHASGRNDYYNSFLLQGTIHDRTIGKQVWEFNYSGKGRVTSDQFVDAVIEKLEADGLLLPPKP